MQTFIYHFILDKEENCRIFVILFISTRQGTCLVSWQAFYACPDASYGGFVPPCRMLMHLLPVVDGEEQWDRRNRFFYFLKLPFCIAPLNLIYSPFN